MYMKKIKSFYDHECRTQLVRMRPLQIIIIIKLDYVTYVDNHIEHRKFKQLLLK